MELAQLLYVQSNQDPSLIVLLLFLTVNPSQTRYCYSFQLPTGQAGMEVNCPLLSAF